MAFPNAKEPGRIEDCHSCQQVRKAAVARAVKLNDRSGAHKSGMLRSLHDKIPILLLEKIVSRSGNSRYLVAISYLVLRKKLLNCLIQQVIRRKQSKERHLSLEPSKEIKYDYLTRANTLGTSPLSYEELIDFLEHIRISTFGVVTVNNKNTNKKDLTKILRHTLCTLTNC